MAKTAWASEFNQKRKVFIDKEKLENLLKEVAESAKPVVANASNTAAVRNKTELGGYTKHYQISTHVINKIKNHLNDCC